MRVDTICISMTRGFVKLVLSSANYDHLSAMVELFKQLRIQTKRNGFLITATWKLGH
jgi:hypothetical protein